MSSRQAFTLVELVIVVAVLAVVSAVAVPRFAAHSDGRRLDLAEQRIGHELGSWIELAKLREASYVVYFDQDSDVCWLLPSGWGTLLDAVDSVELADPPYETQIETRSSDADETQLTIDRLGRVGGDLQIGLFAGSTKRTVSLP